LNGIEGLDWIRILYFYPNRLTDEVIEAMTTCEKVASYIDIPLQHAHPDTLRRMKRPWDGDRYLAVLNKVRQAIPDVAIRSTFIVGFPGETESEFEGLLEFVDHARLDRVGAFVFSKEPGTPSFEMPDQVSSRVKRERFDRLMRRQQKISAEINESWVGKTLKVLVDEVRDDWRIGRSHRDAPEIDGLVFFQGDAQPGDWVDVTITDAEPYDLFGRQPHASPQRKRGLTPLRVAAPSSPL
jgi:ribosomal protein S12 methylthiotransferase